MNWLLSGLYILFTSLGVIFMKLGGDSMSLALKNGIEIKMGFLTFLGFVFYLFSFLLWQKLLISYNLSYIIPILTGIMQVIVLLIGCFAFKEAINIYNVIGVIIIVIGVILLGINGK